MPLLKIADDLTRALKALRFAAPVTFVYNPLDYARAPHAQYVQRFGSAPKEAVFLGMNPGPFGMAQTGVPFGEVRLVKDWIGVEAPVSKPPKEHPKRPITGFACTRSEVSGQRLWGWAQARFVTPEKFFARFFVVNYCPLVFMGESGSNITPDKLPPKEREALFELCDEALRRTIAHLQPKMVVGVGNFAEQRAREALANVTPAPSFGRIPHPSPASPLANRGWAEAAEKALIALGVKL